MKTYQAVAVSCFVSLLLLTCPQMASALSREDVTWTNGDVQLAGTLYLPDGAGPHPAFIFLHGSGPETRSAFTSMRYAREFANNGIAMLLYDKRGAGESTGNWLDATYEDLALDAVAGIEMLVGRSNVDASALGIIGASEGGWTGPIAATRSKNASLLVLISAPPMSPLEQGVFELETSMRKAGSSEIDIAEAVAFERLRRQVQRTNEGWEELDRAIEQQRGKVWYEAAGSPERPDISNPRVRWYGRVMDYDPGPVLNSLTIPALMLYGAKDELVDAERSARRMQEIKDSAQKDFTIHVYPDGQHNLTKDQITFPADHWDRIFNWIESKWERPGS